jgi:hypothetical protein
MGYAFCTNPLESSRGCNEKILTLCLDHEHFKTAIHYFDTLINFLLVPANQPEDYKKHAATFLRLFKKLHHKEPFSDDEQIQDFQNSTDEWYQLWMGLESREGCTNYTHMLGSGHLADMLFHHHNLYIFSNQGWEALNMLMKHVYFWQTTCYGGCQASSRLLPIAQWLQ